MSEAPAHRDDDPLAWLRALADHLRSAPGGVRLARDIEAAHDALHHRERAAERELERERERTCICEGLLAEYQEREILQVMTLLGADYALHRPSRTRWRITQT